MGKGARRQPQPRDHRRLPQPGGLRGAQATPGARAPADAGPSPPVPPPAGESAALPASRPLRRPPPLLTALLHSDATTRRPRRARPGQAGTGRLLPRLTAARGPQARWPAPTLLFTSMVPRPRLPAAPR